MLRVLCALLILVLLVLWPTLAFFNVIDVPADQPTVQAGIDATAEGDTLSVAPSVYLCHRSV